MPLILLLLFLLSPLHAHAREYKGVVIAVADGDTLTMRAYNNRRMTIRLADIDAPEKRQPYGNEAKQSLIGMVQGQPVIVNKKTRDRYQRTVGTVYRASDVLNVNREQTRLGSSWAYRAYLDDPAMLVLEDAARSSQAGLWGLSTEPLPPWQWRHMRQITYKENK